MGGKKHLSEVETVLDDNAALPFLQALEDAGCERIEIISLLTLAFWTNESWKQIVGMDLRSFKGKIIKIARCADLIDKINSSDLIYHVSIEIQLPQFGKLQNPSTLPEQLRVYAENLTYLTRMFGPKSKPRLDAWKASIVAVVMEDTKAPRDKEVSSIIAAILNVDYFEGAHQKWRLDHPRLIKQMRTSLRMRRRQSSPR